MNKIILLLSALFSYGIVDAQHAYFADRGQISFDKIIYTKARMREMQKQFEQQSQGRFGGVRMFDLDNMSESTTEKYVLDFDQNSTLTYADPKVEANENQPRGARMQGMSGRGGGQMRGGNGGAAIQVQATGRGMARNNNNGKIVFQDLKNLTSQVQVQIDDKYIISDSLNQITWRFSDEYRNIAGYECRRVNGSTKDSLYLVAFYTEEIPVSGGPALTNGLPGMILGLAIPEMHIQYWATKVDLKTDPVKTDWKDKKVKNISMDEFVNSFGRYFQRRSDNTSNKRQVQEQLIY